MRFSANSLRRLTWILFSDTPLTWTMLLLLLSCCCVETGARYIETQQNVSAVFEYGETDPGGYRGTGGGGNAGNSTRVIPMVDWEAGKIPHPLKEPRNCGKLGHTENMFCDPSHILTPAEVLEIEETLENMCHSTRCRCHACPLDCPGVRAGVLILPKIKFNESDASSIEGVGDWAEAVREAWRIADSCGPDLLLIYSARDHFMVHASYGQQISGDIWPVCVDTIFNENRDKLVNQEIGAAMVETLRAYRSRLMGYRSKETGCREDFPYILPTSARITIIYSIICLPLISCVIFVFLGPCFRGPGFGGSTSKAGLSRGWTHRSTYEGYDSRWIATPSTSHTQDPRLT